MAEGDYPELGQWTTGWCGCFEDMRSCCFVFCCPCIAIGRVANIVEAGEKEASEFCIFWCIAQCLCFSGCCVATEYRESLRARYDLPAKPCGDFWMHWCCPLCAISQEYRELRNRGWDLSIGFRENKNRTPPQQFMEKAQPSASHASAEVVTTGDT